MFEEFDDRITSPLGHGKLSWARHRTVVSFAGYYSDRAQLVKGEGFRTEHIGVISATISTTESNILEYWKKNVSSSLHMTKAWKMGQKAEDVDEN